MPEPDLEAINEGVQQRYEGKALSETERERRLDKHRHHLIRWAEPTKTVEHEDSLFEIEVNGSDVYCFTCGEWLGLTGIEWPGTPRSKAEAFWLEGPPEDVREARETVTTFLITLVEHVHETVDHVETPEEAREFVIDQAEKLVIG